MPLIVHSKTRADRRVGSLLHFNVQRRIDFQSALVNGRRAVLLLEVAAKLLHKIWCKLVRTLLRGQLYGMRLRLFSLRDRNLLLGYHAIDGVVSTHYGALGMLDRIVIDRRAGKRSQQGGFFNVEIFQLLVEVILGGCSKTVLAVTHEVKIAVQREDLLLRVVAFDLNRKHRFLDFPAETFFRSQKQVLAQLLRERAAAFNHTARHQILDGGSRDAIKIDSPMLVKILVFNGCDGIIDHLRDLIPADNDPPL